jgi:hypothetical protein
MFNTSFQKKTLYASITGLFLGLILLGCPFFVSATESTFEYTGSMTKAGHTYTDYFMTYYTSCSCYVGVFYNGSCYDPDPVTNDANQFKPSCSTGDPQYEWYGSACNINMESCGYSSTNVVPNAYINGVFTDSGGGNWIIAESGSQGWSTSRSVYSSGGDKALILSPFAVAVCDIDNCNLCLTSDTCQNAGCVYEWISAYEYWDCHAPYIAYVPGCGTGFQESCYGCYTQETCESAIPTGVCEWVDKGYGIGCYPTEEVPPEAVWEEPELENCEELSGVEKWLCEIKNWLAGLFMPTQEKVNELNLTIKNFKAKFPFNYANSLSAFFTTIKTGLDTNRDIPIKIFGQEGNVDFDILNAEGSIGGQTETLKNIFYDITTALVIFGFLLWLISFIRRIF